MTEREASDHIEAEKAVLHGAKHNGRAVSREVTGNGEAITWATPLVDLMAAEESARARLSDDAGDLGNRLTALLEQCGAVLPPEVEAFLEERVPEMARESFEGYLQEFAAWVFASCSPIDVVRRLFAWAKQFAPGVLRDFKGKLLDFRALGVLLDETHATVHARVKALFEDAPADWKKSATARRNMARAQLGNGNRRGGESTAAIWTKPNQ